MIVHHTGGSDANPLQDSSNFTFEECNQLHKRKFGFPSSLNYYIGYHYYIAKDGVWYQGRLDTDEGAHTIGQNLNSIGICLAGNFDLTLPTPEQITSLTTLLKRLTKEHGIPYTHIVPHRTYASKTCYGKRLADTWARDLVSPTKNELLVQLLGLYQKLFAILKQVKKQV